MRPAGLVQSAQDVGAQRLRRMIEKGQTNIGTLGQALFLDEELASAIRTSHKSFGAFVRSRPEFVVHGVQVSVSPTFSDDATVEQKSSPLKVVTPARSKMAVVSAPKGPASKQPVVKRTNKGVAREASVGSVARAPVKKAGKIALKQMPLKKASKISMNKQDDVDKNEKEKPKAASGHKKRRSLQIGSLDPPFPGVDGEWFLTEDFVGEKSFGWFECRGCWRSWPSAHAWAEFNQGCQKCEVEFLPKFMWVNFGQRCERDDDSSESDDGPHDCERCEACAKNRRCCRDSALNCRA